MHHSGEGQPDTHRAWQWDDLHAVALRETRRVLGSGHDAEDAAQEAMVRAYRAQGRCATPTAPQAWVRTIARNEAVRAYGRAGSRPTLRADIELAGPDTTEAVLDQITADHALAGTRPAERSLLIRRYVLDQTTAEIAVELGIPHPTVRVQLHRATRRLRERLGSPPASWVSS